MNYWYETIDIVIRIFKSGNQDMIEHVYKVVRSVYDRMPESRDGDGCGHNSCKIIPFPIPKKSRKTRGGRERSGNRNRKAV